LGGGATVNINERSSFKQDKQWTYNITWRRVHVTVVAVERK